MQREKTHVRLRQCSSKAPCARQASVRMFVRVMLRRTCSFPPWSHAKQTVDTFDLVPNHYDFSIAVFLGVMVRAVCDAPGAGGDDARIGPDIDGG